MSVEPERLVMLARYSTVFDAERAKATLETEGIDSVIESNGAPGIFGPGFQGPVPGGVGVLVRSSDVDRAWQVVVDRV
jgi:hypothetical protein